ncbi:MAG: RHS repeat-associated core domain-containing protein [Odoribacter sp.]|nr:RHS repeat-associated core domain-containing protein [Odoribacter sp.]
MRASKIVDRKKTTFVWNGSNLASETTDSSVNTYTYDATGVYIANQNGTVTSYLKDMHGNIAAKADSSGAKLEESYMNYDAYGNQWQGDTPDPFGYCGEYYDEESGLIYLRNRYYESETGRFITEDPAQDGTNWYSYCAGNPVNCVDPIGQNWITDKISDAWNKTKWAFNTVGNYANVAQKAAQRKFWETGSQTILRDNWGYETSAWMLEHSLQDKPVDFWTMR